jgi:carbon-monoxide dehydrogenase medium subunit
LAEGKPVITIRAAFFVSSGGRRSIWEKWMKPAPFVYHAPESVDQAIELLGEVGEDAKLLAGGQSLVPAMNFRILQPSVLIDLNRIDALTYLEPTDDGGVRMGAMTRQAAVEHSEEVAKRVPLLQLAMPLIAHPQIRNRGTIGGSLAHADPAAELPVAAVAADASFVIRHNGSQRTVAAPEFFQGMFTTDLGPQDLLVEIQWPGTPARTGWAFEEVTRRSGDYAMAGVAARVTLAQDGACEQARLVYLNVGDGPTLAPQAADMLRGQSRSSDLFAEAADKAAADEIFPFGNVHASPNYQRHLARVLTIRALENAWQRAAG